MCKTSAILLLSLTVGCGGTSDAGGDGSSGPDAAPDTPVTPNPGFPCAGQDDSNDDGLGGELRCFPAADDPGSAPLVVIEYSFELYDGVEAVHIRLTFDPGFIDNQYGDDAVGWESRDKGHTFKDLAGSDHADLLLVDATGAPTFDLSLDYISEDPSAPCGWASLGPSGKDGQLRLGREADVLGWSSSLDKNLNERGYCAYLDNSPATDATCSPSQDAPNWDYRAVYDLWVRKDAFAPAGFGTAHMEAVHASPSKAGTNTVTVIPGDCPVDWCVDPAGCEGSGGDPCQSESDCPTGEFCGEGRCVPVIL